VPPCHPVSAGYRPGTRRVTFAATLDYPDLCDPITLKRQDNRAVLAVTSVQQQSNRPCLYIGLPCKSTGSSRR
jgi:hypothetical protein